MKLTSIIEKWALLMADQPRVASNSRAEPAKHRTVSWWLAQSKLASTEVPDGQHFTSLPISGQAQAGWRRVATRSKLLKAKWTKTQVVMKGSPEPPKEVKQKPSKLLKEPSEPISLRQSITKSFGTGTDSSVKETEGSAPEAWGHKGPEPSRAETKPTSGVEMAPLVWTVSTEDVSADAEMLVVSVSDGAR